MRLRTPAAQYLESAEDYVRRAAARGGATAWAFADLEPRRVALEAGLRDAMTRMRGVLHRVETRVLAEADRADTVTAWLIGGALSRPRSSRCWCSGRSRIPSSVRLHDVGEVAQALAAGDMDNRCDTHGSDEVSGLARMINLLADTMQGMLTRLRSEAGRSTFSNQLVEALEMADSEAEADRVIARAMGAISDVHPMELLLADSSRAHLERACVHPKTGSPNCAVESPYSCIAVRRGHPQIFPDAEALNACPKLLGRMGGSLSAACVPVNFMGRALGVLHVAGAKGKPPNPEQIAQLTALGVHAGNAHRHAARLRALAAAGEHRQPHGPHQPARRRGSARATSWPWTRRSPSSWPTSTSSSASTTRMGHEAGDRALKLFADTARGVVRDRDHVVRWGGEEFALLLPGANAERAAEVVGRLRAALAQAHLLSGTPIFTASFGISDSTMARDRETLIRLADEALYRSKQAGRDCCTVGDPQLVGPAGRAPRARSGRGGRHHAGRAQQLMGTFLIS